jgi:hypothetical protein
MLPNTSSSAALLLTSRIRIPDNVVYRSFPSETVVLNLQTGQYHGLNATASSMLEALERSLSLRDAANAVAEEYAQPQAMVDQDMYDLCNALLARGLIKLDSGSCP